MKRVYTHPNSLLVCHVQNILENNGIQTLLKNEFAGGAAGDIPVFETWPELWVRRPEDTELALELIRTTTEGSFDQPWHCRECGEECDGNLDICWNCQTSRVP